MQFSIAFALLICSYVQVQVAIAGRILVIIPTPSYSHQIVFRPLFLDLHKRGHELVVITPNPISDRSLKRYTEIDISSLYHHLQKMDFVQLRYSKTWFDQITILFEAFHEITEHILNIPEVQKMYAPGTNEKFDLVIIEHLYYYALIGLAYKIGAPFVGALSFALPAYQDYNMGNPFMPSHPSNWDLGNCTGFNLPLWNRIKNFIRRWHHIHSVETKYVPRQQEIANRLLGSDIPELTHIERNMSITLINHNEVLTFSKPRAPNIINIGGILMTANNTQPVPKDLKKFLDAATNGFVYVSLGSNAKSSTLPGNIKQSLVEVFSELPYKVVWKFEDDLIPDTLKNVYISKWLPQQAILGHPNIKLFVYQGGLQSTEEAVYYGVPLIGMPVLADQDTQVAKMVSLGVARALEITTLTKSDLSQAIYEVISDKRYKQNMLDVSKVYKDRPYDSLKHAVWWIEFVMRYKGARYLQYSVVHEPWYRRYDFDVIAVLAIIVYSVVCLVIFIIIKLLIRISYCTGNSEKHKKLKSN